MERVGSIMADAEVRITEALDEALGGRASSATPSADEHDVFDEAGASFAAALRELLDGQAPGSELDSAEAARFAAARELWARGVGELVSPERFAQLLGVSRQRVQRLCTDHKLAAVQDRRGHWQIPAWQGTLSAAGRERLAEAVETFDLNGASGWSALSWLVQPNPGLDGAAPRDLADHEDRAELLIRTAGRDSAA